MMQRPKTVIIIGAPGSGKDTQAFALTKKFGYFTLVTGDLFRAEISRRTPIGINMQQIMDKGELLPADLVNEVVEQELLRHKSTIQAVGLIFNGHPRLLEEVDDVERLIDRYELRPDLAVLLDVAEENLLTRLIARGRTDDTPDVVRRRIDIYNKDTGPVIDYYQKQNKITVIDGNPPPEHVTESLLALFATFSDRTDAHET